MTTWEHAIERRIVTPQAAYAGLHERDIAMLEQHDYGNLEALVRYRTHDADERAILTIAQIAQLPRERSEMIRDVFAYRQPAIEQHERWDEEARAIIAEICTVLSIPLHDIAGEQITSLAAHLMAEQERPLLLQRFASPRDRDRVLEAAFRFVFALHHHADAPPSPSAP